MSSTTAWLLVGSTHRFDGDICPTHLARLDEGDRAAWVINPLVEARQPLVWLPHSPERLLDDLLAALAVAVLGEVPPRPCHGQPVVRPRLRDAPALNALAFATRQATGLALFLTVSPRSSLVAHLDEIAALEHIAVSIHQLSFERIWNPWNREWAAMPRARVTDGG